MALMPIKSLEFLLAFGCMVIVSIPYGSAFHLHPRFPHIGPHIPPIPKEIPKTLEETLCFKALVDSERCVEAGELLIRHHDPSKLGGTCCKAFLQLADHCWPMIFPKYPAAEFVLEEACSIIMKSMPPTQSRPLPLYPSPPSLSSPSPSYA